MTSSTLINPQIRRRYILGRQGLWPGRRWSGKDGTAAAIRASGTIQIDPVSVLRPSADIVLNSRVADYRPEMLEELLYQDRLFFDYGAHLDIYPIEELPYLRAMMEKAKGASRWLDFQADFPEVADQVRKELRDRGPLCNRDLEGESVNYYRSGKTSGVALYYLWLTGEVMTHHRSRIERYHDFLENIAPREHQWIAEPSQAIDHLIRKSIQHLGMFRAGDFRQVLYGFHGHPISTAEARSMLAEMTTSGQLSSVQVTGEKETYYYPAEDVEVISVLQSGEYPQEWQPIQTSTTEEVVFLSPLEIVSARGRAKEIFTFDYTWEIYTPEPKRKYGPYVMPILYGDRLVARMDSRLDRSSRTLVVNGLWMESWFEVDEAFLSAFSKGINRFRDFLDATQIDFSHLTDQGLQERLLPHL